MPNEISTYKKSVNTALMTELEIVDKELYVRSAKTAISDEVPRTFIIMNYARLCM